MAGNALNFRTATTADVDAIAAVEAASWPAAMAATRAQVACRLAAFPAGQIVAVWNGDIVGVVAAQRISRAFFASTPHEFAALTDGGRFTASHDPQGEFFQLVGVGVLPTAHGLNLGRALVDRELLLARSLPGIERILGFTRPARYYRRRDLPIAEYAKLRNARGRLVDPVLSFHLDSGAQLVKIVEAFRPEDAEACGYGVLIEYPVAP